MKISLKFFLPLIAVVLLLHFPADAREVVTTMAQGEAQKSEGVDTKREALDYALTDSIRAVVLDLTEKIPVKPHPGVESQILSDPLRYIINYKILSERWIAEGEEALETQVEETPPDTEPTSDVEPPSPAEPSSDTEEPAERGYVFDTGPEATTYSVLVEVTIDVGALKDALSRGAAGEEKFNLKLVLLDIRDWETFSSLLEKLKNTAFIEEVSYSSFSPGRFVLTAAASGDLKELRTLVAETAGEEFIVVLLEPDTIVIKASPVEEAFE